jgi:hypothetical protein
LSLPTLERLFNNGNWNLAETIYPTSEYQAKFNQYILASIQPEERGEAADVWETKRGIQLRTMLDWNNVYIPGWNDKTRYMLIKARQNEFKNRSVLLEPSAYIK